MELEEKVSQEPKAIDPQEPVVHEQVVDVLLPPRSSSRIFRYPERYMGMLTEEVKISFLMGDKDHGDDPNTFDKAMYNIDSEK